MWQCVELEDDPDEVEPEHFVITNDLGEHVSLDALVPSLKPGIYGVRRNPDDPWVYLSVVEPKTAWLSTGDNPPEA